MGLGARLAKAEEQALRVLRCAWCRYALVEDYQVKAQGKEVARDFVMCSCHFCGNEFKMPLDGMTPKERETYVLWAYTFDGETFRDERAYAAREWWVARATVRAIMNPRRPSPRRAQDGGKPGREALERAALKAEADALRDAALKRERRLYGPRKFPLVGVLRELRSALDEERKTPYMPGFVYRPEAEKQARSVLIFARCMEACELVLWGAVEPETAAQIEAKTAEVADYDEKREREREEKERQERERAEQFARAVTPPGVSPVPGAPVSRFRTSNAPVPPNPMVFDPTAAHVPDPADPSKQIVVSPGVSVWDAKKHEPARMAGFVDDGPGFMRSEAPEKLPDHEKYYRGEYYDGD